MFSTRSPVRLHEGPSHLVYPRPSVDADPALDSVGSNRDDSVDGSAVSSTGKASAGLRLRETKERISLEVIEERRLCVAHLSLD